MAVPKHICPTLALLSVLSLPSPSAAQTPPRPAGKAAGAEGILVTVQARGGHPVREVENSILFQDRLSARATAAKVEGLPFAASAGSSVELEVRVELPDATSTRCSWIMAGTEASGKGGFEGPEGRLEVKVPERIGIYDFSLACEAEDLVLPAIESTLFVTLGEPSLAYSPPETAWYRQACSLAAGLSPADGEAAVLELLLRGIRAFGSQHWRYGYCIEVGSECFFGDQRVVHPPASDCFSDGSCKCPWQDLLSNSPCNFSDCFTLSDILDVLAGVLGIHQLEPIRVEGSQLAGFATRAGLRSLDPQFAGNIVCGPAEKPCSYLFNVHSLRKKGRLFYDATFTETYLHRDGPIGASIAESTLGHGFVGFVDSPFVACRDSCEGNSLCYDDWGLSTLRLLFLSGLCSDTRESGARFTGAVSFSANDYRALSAELEVEILRAGTYTVNAALVKEGRLVASLPFWTDQSPAKVEIGGEPGIYGVTVFFSGEQIYRSQEELPYVVQAVVFSETSAPDTLTTVTPAFPAKRFGELECEILRLSTHAKYDPQPGRFEIMVVLEVRKATTFVLAAGLEQDGETIAYVEKEAPLATGLQSVKMAIPAAPFAGLAGPYELTVIAYGSQRTAVDSESITIRDLGGLPVE